MLSKTRQLMLGSQTTRHIRIQFRLHRTLRTRKGVTMATNRSMVMGIRAQLLMYLRRGGEIRIRERERGDREKKIWDQRELD